MKKIFYFLSILLFGAAACSENLSLTYPEEGQDTVVFDMSVTLPEAVVTTRGARQDTPVIDHIYVATFGNSGYLNEYVKAVPISGIGGEVTSGYASTNGTTYYFRVALLATTSNRYVHIIANGPTQFTYQTQDKDILLETLVTSGNEGAYWQYFQLPDGTAKWSTSSGNWTASQDAINKFRNVKLIRNFARISVRNNATNNFTLEKFYVCRTMKDGSITMPALSSFDANGNKVLDDQGNKISGTADQVSGTRDGFVNALDYALAGENTDPVGYVKNTLKYDGYMPTTDRVNSTASASLVDNGYTQSQFVYESTDINRHSNNFPFILLKGKYNDGTEHASSYYKIELTDEDGNLIPIYRNFDYTITITRVSANGVAAADVNNDMVTSNANVSVAVGQELSDVSDGVSGLYVLYSEKTYANADVDGDGHPVNKPIEFKYKYVPDLEVPGTVSSCELSIVGITTLYDAETDTETPLAGHAIANTSGTWYTQSSSADVDGWYTVTMNVLPSTTYNKLAGTTFKVLGKTTDDEGREYKLFREVNVKLIPVQSFTKAITSGTGTTKNTSVNITLGLPQDLPQSIFPLTITVRDSALALNPDNDNEMPLTIDHSKTNPYHFTRTVTWSEYNPTTGSDISCKMHLIQNITSTTITIENEFFTTKTLTYPAQ